MSVVGRAKIVTGCELLWVACSREIAGGSVAICGSRAKVCIGCVMLVRRRKFAYRYVMIGVGCSVDYCRLFSIINCIVQLVICRNAYIYAYFEGHKGKKTPLRLQRSFAFSTGYYLV